MSCPSEACLALYADGELAGEELTTTESHLVGCRECRGLVVALRDESTLLAEVLQERGRASHAPAPSPAPEPGMAVGIPIAIAAVSVALSVAGALLEAHLPGALDLLHPRRLKGVIEMAFDLVFLLRQNAPGLLELALSVGVVATVSAVGSVAVSAISRRIFGGAALLCLAALASPAPARAVDVHVGQQTWRVAEGERVAGTVLVSAEDVYVEGVVAGDLIAAAERVNIRGEVTGSVYVFTRELDVTGRVGGTVHAVDERADVDGTIGGNVYHAGESFALGRDGRVAGDVNVVGEEIAVEGSVGRDLYAAGGRLELQGEVGRDLDSPWIEQAILLSDARVAGDVHLAMEEGREPEIAPGAALGGEVETTALHAAHRRYLDHYTHGMFYVMHLLTLGAAFVFGLLVHLVAPQLFRVSLVTSRDFFRSLGLGFVVLVVTPAAILAAALTVVGIPAAILTLFVYIVALYTAELVVSAWLGRLIWPPSDDSTLAFGRSFFVGLAIITLLTHLPFLGPPVALVALLLGLGLIAHRARAAFVPAAA